MRCFMTNIKVKADSNAKKEFGIKENLTESEAQDIARKINQSGKGDAKLENGVLNVRGVLID